MFVFASFSQGFPGDFGERGPPGIDGNPVSCQIFIIFLLFSISFYTIYSVMLVDWIAKEAIH